MLATNISQNIEKGRVEWQPLACKFHPYLCIPLTLIVFTTVFNVIHSSAFPVPLTLLRNSILSQLYAKEVLMLQEI